jgi:DNA end-binding protein Ku
MSKKIWTGYIGFGLVNIPVALLPAEAREELEFTLIDERDRSPIGYRKVSKRSGQEVPGNRIVRGFEYAKGRYVIVRDEDLRRASPERTQRIEIHSFVNRQEVDPRYYERPYYLQPERRAEKSYALLREALRRTGKAAVATVVVRARQHLAAVIAHDSVLLLEQLRFASELRDPNELAAPRGAGNAAGISGKELELAEKLIEEMTARWDPSKYRDEYRSELLAFIKQRARSGKVTEIEEPAAPQRPRGQVIDIMDLLKRSVAQVGEARPARRRRNAS